MPDLYPDPLFLADDDVHLVYPVTDANDVDLTWEAIVMVGDTEITGEWLGDAAATRDLKVPFTSIETPGTYRLRLVIPDDNDLDLGEVTLH